ncbi:hypothetical protein B566_EDAN013924 [Ephemera danica]|nr:hypothetical protein B566_EDAN013924 [Ephemera danica]
MLSHHVKCVRPLPGDAWELEVTDLSTKITQKHEFDAVMVCNGDPIMPNLEGTDDFKGSQIHSHDYRVPEVYQGQKVLVVGAGPSAMDVVQEVHEFATHVIMSHHKTINTKFPDNVQQVCDVKRYKYSLPFLDPSCGISMNPVTGVGPLYRHILHLERPTMCFLALSRYFLRVLDGSLQLPSLEERQADTARDQEKRRLAGHVGVRLSHYLGPMQREYYDLLATEAGIESIPPVISALHAESHKGILHNLFNYRKIKTFYEDK